jgi:polar amino acid transport system substrate-binding protein
MNPVLAVLALALLQPAAAPTPLRVGTETRQPPWAYFPGASTAGVDLRKNPPALTPATEKALVGLDMDIMKALARRLGRPLQVVPWSWWDLENGLVAGRFDVILSSWTPSPRTPATIWASPPYATWGLLVATRAGETSIQSFADLTGKRVAHYSDPAVARSLQAMGRGTFLPFDDPDHMFALMKDGKLDAVIFDSPYVRWKVARDPGFRVVGEPLNRLGYHVGVRRDDAALAEAVQKALAEMQAAGELDAIMKEWAGPAR